MRSGLVLIVQINHQAGGDDWIVLFVSKRAGDDFSWVTVGHAVTFQSFCKSEVSQLFAAV